MTAATTAEAKIYGGIESSEDSECWVWIRSRNRYGYGSVGHRGKSWLAHRFAYEALVGPIPEGMTLDHLCRNKPCINPMHLEPVSRRENTRRALPYKWENYREDLEGRQICANGHEQNAATQRVSIGKNGEIRRACRPCQAAAQRRAKAKRERVIA